MNKARIRYEVVKPHHKGGFFLANWPFVEQIKACLLTIGESEKRTLDNPGQGCAETS
jgi:hypothetical protein